MIFIAFVTSTPLPNLLNLPNLTTRRSATCARRLPKAQTINPGPPNTGEWSDGASLQEGLQEIEFVIRPTGIVEEHVMGVKGNDCVKLTESIESALGEVITEEKTSEYFEQPVVVRENLMDAISDGSEGSWSSESPW